MSSACLLTLLLRLGMRKGKNSFLLHDQLFIQTLFSDQLSPLPPTHPPIPESGPFVPVPSESKLVLS